MYQFYYADNLTEKKMPIYKRCVWDEIDITAVRPTMWEEHCLECAAPLCFEQCVHYAERSDGRCKRFENGISITENDKGVGNQCARVKFRKWANMMTIIFPGMLSVNEYNKLIKKNQKLGNGLKLINQSPFPQSLRWQGIRTIEFIRRKCLRNIQGLDNQPEMFVFHGYNFEESSFRLILEIFNDHTSMYKYSWIMEPGENLIILDKEVLSEVCWKENYLVKIYPENDLEAEVDILWCDFVKGTYKKKEKAADKVKCVVWDLDHTLWDGILIETEDESKIQLKNQVKETICALDERGILQSIASKNEYAHAWKVVERLGVSDYFLYPQIHWNAKSGSMKQIAMNLNIGIDSLAFIDDSAFEREQVCSEIPQIRVYDANEVKKLLSYPEFQVIVTDESRNRRNMYLAEMKRKKIQNADKTDSVDFLKKCHLEITVFEPKTEEEINRCYELVVRTNQLNMSGKRYTREEFEDILKRKNVYNFAFTCKDDFGSYGIVGFGQYQVCNSVIVFDEFAMSCRVAGKYVESALFAYLLKIQKCTIGEFGVNKTKKNILLRNTLEKIGFNEIKNSNEKVVYSFNNELLNKSIVSIV